MATKTKSETYWAEVKKLTEAYEAGKDDVAKFKAEAKAVTEEPVKEV